jgi:hypothetical protein
MSRAPFSPCSMALHLGCTETPTLTQPYGTHLESHVLDNLAISALSRELENIMVAKALNGMLFCYTYAQLTYEPPKS